MKLVYPTDTGCRLKKTRTSTGKYTMTRTTDNSYRFNKDSSETGPDTFKWIAEKLKNQPKAPRPIQMPHLWLNLRAFLMITPQTRKLDIVGRPTHRHLKYGHDSYTATQ